jgi:hypothetical protein
MEYGLIGTKVPANRKYDSFVSAVKKFGRKPKKTNMNIFTS